MNREATRTFHVDLGDLEIDDAAAQRLGVAIQNIVTRHLADISLSSQSFAIGRLGPGTVGLIANPPLDGDALHTFSKAVNNRSKGRVYHVDLGGVELPGETSDRIGKEITSAVLEAVGFQAITGGTAIFGRLGPGLAGYLLRNDLKSVVKSLKA